MIRVLIVDDQALVRGGFAMILSAQPDIDVVGMAEDGAQAVNMASELAPDVILMDVRMPVMDGLDATRRILAEPGLHTKVVMLTTFDLDEYVYAALRAGASGFLHERLSVLTTREVEVLQLIGRGATNTEISQALWVAETTVKTHVTRIFRKLGLRDRAQAVVLAYESGLVKAGEQD